MKMDKKMRFILSLLILLIMLPPLLNEANAQDQNTSESEYDSEFKKHHDEALQGIAGSQFHLALMYRDGKGTEQSSTKELYWYQQAAKQGFRPAIFNLGVMYFEGNGIKRDVETGLTYLHWAQSLDYAPATEALGRIYVHGKNGAPKDVQKGISYITKGANEGMPISLYLLAHAYMKGIGVEKDEDKGIVLLNKAAKEGAKQAQNEILKIEDKLGIKIEEYLQEIKDQQEETSKL